MPEKPSSPSAPKTPPQQPDKKPASQPATIPEPKTMRPAQSDQGGTAYKSKDPVEKG